jgi:transcriptional regulator with XRE-family HTH domain
MAIVRERMTELDYTAADVARMSGIPPSTLSRFLHSKKHPDIGQVRRIAIAVKISMPELMSRAEA